jgi:hypothetical protein
MVETNGSESQPVLHEDKQALVMVSRGKQGLIGAAIVFSVFLLIISLSKANDIAKRRLPMMWRMRLRKMIRDAIERVEQARETSDQVEKYKNLVYADTLLDSAKRLVGTGTLSEMAAMDVTQLEYDIEEGLAETQRSLKRVSL